jgi:hypothetical protein
METPTTNPPPSKFALFLRFAVDMFKHFLSYKQLQDQTEQGEELVVELVHDIPFEGRREWLHKLTREAPRFVLEKKLWRSLAIAVNEELYVGLSTSPSLLFLLDEEENIHAIQWSDIFEVCTFIQEKGR